MKNEDILILAKEFVGKRLGKKVCSAKLVSDSAGGKVVRVYADDFFSVYEFDSITLKEKNTFNKGKIKKFEKSDSDFFWKRYLSDVVLGPEKIEIIEAIIDQYSYEFSSNLEKEIKDYKDYLVKDFDNNECESWGYLSNLLQMEEKLYTLKAAKCETGQEFLELAIELQNKKAMHCSFVFDKIKQFINDNVSISTDINGEQVYDFDEQSIAVYEYLKRVNETIDFDFRYKLYRLQMEEEKQQIQNED